MRKEYVAILVTDRKFKWLNIFLKIWIKNVRIHSRTDEIRRLVFDQQCLAKPFSKHHMILKKLLLFFWYWRQCVLLRYWEASQESIRWHTSRANLFVQKSSCVTSFKQSCKEKHDNVVKMNGVKYFIAQRKKFGRPYSRACRQNLRRWVSVTARYFVWYITWCCAQYPEKTNLPLRVFLTNVNKSTGNSTFVHIY